ncbi:MAG: bifunctional precorrin-2 dehydrogenase/sirohydrochlorin ferrochelatase [Tannerellaceae bacterium]|jgi:siroheme synthase-like protein|nr:bifunctional precorrin-2 dehydrogenase/sirohydrochlorin ferrochelatase [Tannerellaceae bacterium]
MNREELQFLPVSINIRRKKILIIGGGKVAFHKATVLSRFSCKAKVIAPRFYPGFEDLPFELIPREYTAGDLDGAFLVYICTGDEALNASVKASCEERGILASVCDNPLLCDFISPAIHQEGYLTVAVSSDARNVRRSIDIRNRIRTLFENKTIKIK